MSNWEYYLKTIIKYGIYAALFTPLVYLSSTFFPFIFGKTLFFRTMIEILFTIYLILAIVYPRYRPKRSLLFSAVLIYAGISVLATLFSVDPVRSFWSNTERMMGLWTLLHAMMLFVVTGSIFKTKKEWRSVFGVSVWASIIVGGLGIYQYFSDGFLHTAGGGRVFSTLGNYIYFGGYGLIHAVIAAIFFLEEKKKKSLVGVFWILGILMGVTSVYLSGTRGVLVAFCGAIFLTIMLHVVFYSSKKIRLLFVSILILIAVVGAGLWLNREASFVKKNYLLSSMLDISLNASTGQTRIMNWAVGFEAWKQRPILGWGPDTYYIAFNKHYNPKMFEFGEYETWQDHAHNIIVDTLIESGIIGLISYLSIFLFAFYLIFKSVKRKKLKFSSGVLLFSGLSAYFIQNFFVFDTLTLLMVFYLILGFIYSSDVYKTPNAKEHEVSEFVKKLDSLYKSAFVVILLLSTFFFIYLTSITQYNANAMTITALKSVNQSFDTSIETLKKMSSVNSPYLQETRVEFAKLVTLAINSGLSKDKARVLLLIATEELKKTVRDHPLDFYHWNYLGRWYLTLAQVVDSSYFEEAKEAIDRAMELGPKRQQAYFTLGRYYMARKEHDKAVEIFQSAVDLAPGVRNSHWELGLACVYAGDLEKAYEEFEIAHEKSIPLSNSGEIILALSAYTNAKDTDGIEWLFEKCIQSSNCGPFEHAKFARAYRKLGNQKRMLEFFQAALEFDPSLQSQIEDTINED
ncbi:MAG: O-antigen ligase family protein [Patescibacteria group bacterium]|nr:O-antigen ligase family protein [Patescibacteria group bacterium]